MTAPIPSDSGPMTAASPATTTNTCFMAGDSDCSICTTTVSARVTFVAKGIIAAPICSRKSPQTLFN